MFDAIRFRGGGVCLGLGQLRAGLSPWRSSSDNRNRRAWWCVCSGTRVHNSIQSTAIINEMNTIKENVKFMMLLGLDGAGDFCSQGAPTANLPA